MESSIGEVRSDQVGRILKVGPTGCANGLDGDMAWKRVPRIVAGTREDLQSPPLRYGEAVSGAGVGKFGHVNAAPCGWTCLVGGGICVWCSGGRSSRECKFGNVQRMDGI